MDLPQALWWLAVGHVVSDFVLQPEFMANAKHPASTYLRSKYGPWWLWMGGHGIMNGAVTALILGAWWVGPIEAAHHALTDWAKCKGHIGFWQDQVSHGLMKGLLLWLVLR